MSKITLEIRSQAEDEFYDIVDYYREIDVSLADEFIAEFELFLEKILEFPQAGHPYLNQTKRVILDRFPYSLIYKIYRDEIVVVYAVMHMRRKPGYWTERLK
ncbi:MAG: type II toxin-antitoxin system RelE/ParE family toxin [Balneolaceae bacterium]